MDLTTALAVAPLVWQLKLDRRGSEVSEADTNRELGAVYLNLVDDWLIAMQTTIDSLGAGAAVVLDTRSSGETTTASIAGGATGDFEITVPKTRMRFDYLRCLSNSAQSGPTGRLQFFADAGRTKEVYNSLLKVGSPPVDTDDFVDSMSWGAYADDGTGLTDLILYGTVTNGGGSASTFTIRVVGMGY